MSNEIVSISNQKLPRAIAKEKDGIILFWVEELQDGGLHQNGIAQLLECDPRSIGAQLNSGEEISVLEAEILTTGGLKVVKLILSETFSALLEKIIFSKMDEAVRRRAAALQRKLAQAGFKLAVMLELAPQQLAQQTAENARLKELELELQCRQAEQKLLDTRHLIVTTCPEVIQQKILGYQLIEKIEYVDRALLGDQFVTDGSTVNKSWLCKRFGFVTRNGSPDYKGLNRFLSAINLPSEAIKLTAQIREGEELRREYLPILDRAYQTWDRRNLWLGE